MYVPVRSGGFQARQWRRSRRRPVLAAALVAVAEDGDIIAAVRRRRRWLLRQSIVGRAASTMNLVGLYGFCSRSG